MLVSSSIVVVKLIKAILEFRVASLCELHMRDQISKDRDDI